MPSSSTARAGVGKTEAAFAFAGARLGDARRVVDRTHPDLRVVEPLGDMIRIDVIRELHHDLHLRPFEADCRVYLLLSAHLLNDDAADALLKDLEEPPLYATIVLVADELGPIPETIRSRCQLVPFRRLSERAVRDWLGVQRPGSRRGRGDVGRARRRGRLDRARRLIDPEVRERRAAIIAAARGPYLDPEFEPADASRALLDAVAASRHDREGQGGGGRGRPRPDAEGRRAADQARPARRRARGDAGAARRDRGVVPRPRRRRERSRSRPRSTPTGSTISAPTSARDLGRGPSGRRRSCARRGGRPRSSTSTPGSGSTRSSCSSAARSPDSSSRLHA